MRTVEQNDDRERSYVQPYQSATVERMTEGHMSIRAIATATGMSPTTVQKHTRQEPDENGMINVGKTLGLDGKVRPDRRFDTTDRDERIYDLYWDEHKSMREIADEIGCSVGTVHRAVHGGRRIRRIR